MSACSPYPDAGPTMAQYAMYHPDVVQLRMPRLRYDEPDDLLLIPVCPCCGQSRTVHIHVQQTPRVILEPSFRDWCRNCREKMADKLDAIDKRRKDFWG